ncbi:hypothetical protein ACYULU_15355, partial [Breznakiellaceae bacterium SP9]
MANGGTFEMRNGSISNNISNLSGGGVYVGAGSYFTMYSGNIYENKAPNGIGGGVYVGSTPTPTPIG